MTSADIANALSLKKMIELDSKKIAVIFPKQGQVQMFFARYNAIELFGEDRMRDYGDDSFFVRDLTQGEYNFTKEFFEKNGCRVI